MFVLVSTDTLAAEKAALDELAKQLEATRLQYKELHPSGDGFAKHFWDVVIPILQDPKQGVELLDLELALRKASTGIFLIAVPAEFAPGSLCVRSITGEARPRRFWVYMAGTGKSEADSLKAKYGIADDESNRKNLRETGVLTACPP